MSFKELLKRDAGSVERPKPLPGGDYSFVIKSYEFGQSAKKKTDQIEFKVKPLAAIDVDEEVLAQMENWRDKEMRLTFYITSEALYRLTEFQEHCGLETSGRTIEELIPEMVNCSFGGRIEHSPSQRDPSIIYAEIGATFKIE